MVSDKNGERLWIAVMGGGVFYMDLKTGKINRCDTFESGKEYQENYNALHNRWVSSLLCTSNGKLYIGTYDGLGCLDISTMSFTSTYKKNRIFGGSIVLTLFEDERGDIWAGTTKGLIHIDGKMETLRPIPHTTAYPIIPFVPYRVTDNMDYGLVPTMASQT